MTDAELQEIDATLKKGKELVHLISRLKQFNKENDISFQKNDDSFRLVFRNDKDVTVIVDFDDPLVSEFIVGVIAHGVVTLLDKAEKELEQL